jgi:hypothetical protein
MGKKSNARREIFIQIKDLFQLCRLCDEFLFKKDYELRTNDEYLQFLNEVNTNTCHAVYDNYVMCKINTTIKKEEIQKFCREYKLGEKSIFSYVEKYIRYL